MSRHLGGGGRGGKLGKKVSRILFEWSHTDVTELQMIG